MIARAYSQPTTIIIKNNMSNAAGIASFVFGFISIFILAPLFVPLAILMGIVAIISRQIVWGSMGLLCAFIGFLTSPILMGLLGIATVASFLPSHLNPAQQTMQHKQEFESNAAQLINKMEENDAKMDKFLEQLPGVEQKYIRITAKVQTYYDKARTVASSGNQYAVGQIEYAMNQGRYATDQVHYEVQSLDTSFNTKIGPLVKDVVSYENSCKAINSVQSDLLAVCQKFTDASHLFGTKVKAMADGLKNLEQTYKSESDKQGDLVMAVQHFQYP